MADRVIDTPEFKAWFGDSKVVDKNGEPLVVYHGTSASEFSKFKGMGVAGWFSEDPELANVYAEERGVEEERIYPVYLSVKYPFDFVALGLEAETEVTATEFAEKTGLDIPLEDVYEDDDEKRPVWNYFEDFISDPSFLDSYDGIYIKEKGGITWGVFGAEQIKSAIGNRGTFDPSDPDITASVSKVPPEIEQKFQDLADQQRGIPEEAMKDIQMTNICQLYGFVIEHTGDLIHRMSENINFQHGGFSLVKEKVDKVLRVLDAGDHGWLPFEKDIERQTASNVQYRIENPRKDDPSYKTAEEATEALKTMSKAYEDAHRGLPTYNRVQELAKKAAVALGDWDFNGARLALYDLRDILNKGPEAWAQAAMEHESATTAAKTKAKSAPTLKSVDTDSAEFKAWFGDSKVVDAQGNPMVVYHATGAPSFSVFEGYDIADWFAEDPAATRSYETKSYVDPETGAESVSPHTYPVYLSIENPLDLIALGLDSEAELSAKDFQAKTGLTYAYSMPPDQMLQIYEHLRVASFGKYDGIKMVEKGAVTWAILDPAQAKSALTNTGEFDPKNPDITAAKRALAMSTISEGVLYRGAEAPDFGKGDFKGSWFSEDREVAAQYGPVWEYIVLEPLKLADNRRSVDPMSGEKGGLQYEFVQLYPEQKDIVNQDGDYAELWLFPPDEFVDLLAEKGYDGYRHGTDIFLVGASLGRISLRSAGAFVATNSKNHDTTLIRGALDDWNAIPLYHGSSSRHKKLMTGMGDRAGGALYFHKDPFLAEQYGPNIKEVQINVANTFNYHLPEHQAILQEALKKERGYESWWVKEAKDGDWEMIEKPSIIRTMKEMGFDSYLVNDHPGDAIGVFDDANIVQEKLYKAGKTTDTSAAKSFFTESTASDYKFWITPDGKLFEFSNETHDDYAKRNKLVEGFSYYAQMLSNGWIPGGRNDQGYYFRYSRSVPVSAIKKMTQMMRGAVKDGYNVAVDDESWSGGSEDAERGFLFNITNKMELGRALRKINKDFNITAAKKPEVFLGGEVKTDWRDDIIKEFKDTLKLIDPVDPDWTPEENIYDELAEALDADEVIFFKGGEGTEGEKAVLDAADKDYAEFDDLKELEEHLEKISSMLKVATYYHVAPKKRRKLIEKNGLVRRDSSKGIYVWDDWEVAQWFRDLSQDDEDHEPMDIWTVVLHEGDVVPDPETADMEAWTGEFAGRPDKNARGFIYMADNISPAHLYRVANITLPIKVGDEILTGHWKNHPVKVKSIGEDEKGQPTINGRPILNIRVPKLMPKKKAAKKETLDSVAAEIFRLNVEQFKTSENEFAVVIYFKDGAFLTSAPIAGDAQDVAITQMYESNGAAVAVVHSHPDGGTETTDADDAFGEEMAEMWGSFSIFTIGFDELGQVSMSRTDYGNAEEPLVYDTKASVAAVASTLKTADSDEQRGWISPDGQYTQTEWEEHIRWALENVLSGDPKYGEHRFVKDFDNVPMEELSEAGTFAYTAMYDLGWVRVAAPGQLSIKSGASPDAGRTAIDMIKEAYEAGIDPYVDIDEKSFKAEAGNKISLGRLLNKVRKATGLLKEASIAIFVATVKEGFLCA